MNIRLTMASIVALSFAGPARAQTADGAKSLDDLLKRVKEGWRAENEELKRRETEFLAEKKQQAALLAQAKATHVREEKRGLALEREFEEKEKQIADLEQTLQARLGNMGELFGLIRQVAGDTRGHLSGSLTSAQFVDRLPVLDSLAESKALPSVEELDQLWFLLQQEMTESGKVVRFKAPVISPKGGEAEQDVVRVGVFNAVSAGKYLAWKPEVKKLTEIARQPPSRYLGTVGDLESATGTVRFAIDPSRGSILSLLVQTPDTMERLEYGGVIGYLIIVLGIGGFIIGLFRLVYLFFVGGRVRSQQKTAEPKANNPLGRVLAVAKENPDLDNESLELKLDEVILREQAGLERFLWLIKVVSVVAPLMGLLGTVTGMIRTFQAITLFGTGDPKLMAGGISEALVTTMLGLIVAIPLVLMHSWVSSMSRDLMDVLGEQSAGIIARRVESTK